MPSTTAEQLNQSLDPATWPRIDYLEVNQGVASINAFVPDTLAYFAGHFPEQAVLPGVVQVHWVGELAQLLFGVSGFSDLKSIKFNGMILPLQEINLQLKYSAEKRSLRFTYSNGEDKFSSGMLSFNNAGQDAAGLDASSLNKSTRADAS